MASAEKNNQLYIDKEAFSALTLMQEGLLYPVTSLMSKQEMQENIKTGTYKGCSYPCPLLLSPSGKRNKEILKRAKKDEVIDLVCEGEVIGNITVDEVFTINAQQRLLQIGAILEEKNYIAKRIGEYALSGKIAFKDSPLSKYKKLILDKKKQFNAKNITGIVLNANPIHRVHEKILRDELANSDLVVIFLLKHHKNDFLGFDLRKRSLEYVLNNFFAKERICIIPLDATYLFIGQNKIILYSLVAKNYGCTKLLVGQKTSGLSLYYNKQTRHSVLDSIQGIDIDINILDEYVYCTKCQCLLNTKSCPHGKHHHISYRSSSILQFFKMGIIPPTILMRKEISALILKTLFPQKLEAMKPIYYNILPSDGIFSEDIQEDFYTKLIELYKIRN
ncbi:MULTISPECIES: sulfate adenylyltransferase [unclassified Helicobacter]|uniref:sulfate adenylyltransferase n=1 Tax=unclassified Helicobacter TaxID=2593540 RepID=UPI000CF073D1|nr:MULTISPECIES: sulfate adenylyltransferase [unclassified Helicobacter]